MSEQYRGQTELLPVNARAGPGALADILFGQCDRFRSLPFSLPDSPDCYSSEPALPSAEFSLAFSSPPASVGKVTGVTTMGVARIGSARGVDL